ncbi:benzoyl-CoA 2,3-epoxidase subunit BoxA [Rhodopseudomonas sp. P2A-2r]|uniref:benzoyl-CoA 2,3-epoxidase subunit BoxA n=1 Tax=unclassified Rhodopseudomonas TaxID=2638247 RepID=UPI002234B5EF|nr:benzoyl-CoA 2,3-epoxidase subunit BoxA [Rhodopseudomonas sp. P2A-2r]UZE52012.1 benzoyl-CoA 2,3-epoxidase subunit BoxA [Rhodopseudomonas sp. P2A-2r]
MNAPLKQHLIDPEICIRCNTCEESCPIDAVTHDDNNYVVNAEICNYCMDCISPCPTGAIDNWRVVAAPYSLEEQLSWSDLPVQQELDNSGDGGAIEALEDDIGALLEEARKGLGGKPVAPPSASKPSVNLYNRGKPAIATVTGNFRLTHADADSDVRHMILDFGDQPFPVLEGQSIGVVPPGTDAEGRPHQVRLYSIASSRDGEKPNANNLALTVKRETDGVCSNYLCDLPRGAKVQVTGPFGATFLLPNDPAANILMICTGTGSAPFRGFTERRRRAMPSASGRLTLFFGARRPEELPYFGPLQKVPEKLLKKHFCYSRVPGEARVYVQDRIRSEAAAVTALLNETQTHIYICGLKGMESGVEEAFSDVCRAASIDWSTLKAGMRASGRYHVETY